MRQVYLDYSATTPVKEEVMREMIPYFTQMYGNPSSLYTIGAASREAIDKARVQVAELINAQEKEIFFTSGGTEADNWAVLGIADSLKNKGNHIITTKIEHHAMLHSCEYLEKHGYEVTYLGVDSDGRVNPEDLKKAITDKTILISIMFVNNEIGTVQPIKELAAIAKEHGIIFHTDAVQAIGNVPIDVKELGIDLMSMSAHKIYGPKGIGALYIKKSVRLSNYMHGGAQESKKRAGTENLPGIVGFGKAAEFARVNLDEHIKKVSELRDYFINQVMEKIEHVTLNGSKEHRHPGNANLTFEYIEGEAMLLYLDMKGISVSTGSACSSASLVPSHVLSALGIPVEKIHGSLRFTIGEPTTKEDIDYVVENLVEVVNKLRSISSVSSVKGW
ncbi:cysteine desulfurase NifS [Clostridium aminobutyricum]|uniref:Cysteine desulfurase IscS n=1 Tax=Clostridium aminobutyricum TaxID=33953 RepID=A0A939IG43_CLOAM|nr:cysteine desulfurase NifS [Clostridium aminobutyricum]MBN7772540.1 cysteine desulfurase NifS [Clostridium aminobutyricum]